MYYEGQQAVPKYGTSMENPDRYIRENIPVKLLTDKELHIGMCFKSQKRTETCRKCPGKCLFGREILRREDITPEERQRESLAIAAEMLRERNQTQPVSKRK